MSRIITIVNDELKERQAVGQGWNGFYLWTGNDNAVLSMNYMANRAFDTNTSLRYIDEYQLYDENDDTYFKYKEASVAEMKQWLTDNYPRYYSEKEAA